MSSLKVIDTVRRVAARLNNGRTLSDIMNHANSEIDELNQELTKYRDNQPPGEDGIVGEAIDVILCMLDLIHQVDPSVSNDYIYAKICEKLDKWERKYGVQTSENIQ